MQYVHVERTNTVNPKSVSRRRAVAAVVLMVSITIVAGCGGPAGHRAVRDSLPLAGIQWNLLALGNDPITVADEKERPHFLLQGDRDEVTGFSGCNRFFGTCEYDDETIRFGPMGSTRMMCAQSADLETRFLQTLASADRYGIAGEILELYNGDRRLARFKAGP